MGKKLIEIGTWIATGAVLIVVVAVVCYLLYKTFDAIRYGEFIYALVFFVLAMLAVSLSMMILSKAV